MFQNEEERPRGARPAERSCAVREPAEIRDTAAQVPARRGTPMTRSVDEAVEAMWDNVPV